MDKIEQVKKRLENAALGLGREMAHEGGLPDCSFSVAIKDGAVVVAATGGSVAGGWEITAGGPEDSYFDKPVSSSQTARQVEKTSDRTPKKGE